MSQSPMGSGPASDKVPAPVSGKVPDPISGKGPAPTSDKVPDPAAGPALGHKKSTCHKGICHKKSFFEFIYSSGWSVRTICPGWLTKVMSCPIHDNFE